MFTSRSVPVASLLIVLLFQTCCNDNPVEPIKDPRTYTWTIDTLAYTGSLQTLMRDIWASSSSDVYVVGHNDQNRGLMWHYDGNRWTDVKLSTTQGGNIQGPIDLRAIHGFSKDNIWAVGERIYQNPAPPPNFLDSSLVIQYDGRQWREHTISGGRLLQAIWGGSPSDLWTGGLTKHLYHYDGSNWQSDSLPVTIQSDSFFQINSLEGNSGGEVFAIGNTSYYSQPKTIFYFFHKRSAQEWALIDSFVVQPGQSENKWGYADLWVSPSGTLYSCGGGIHKWNGNTWSQLFNHSSFLSQITGTSGENIFVVGHFGTILHYNGRDWYQYQQFANPDAVLWGVWTDGKEVFIVGHTAQSPQKTLIFHGK